PRGILQNTANTSLPNFPAQQPLSTNLNNSKGLALGYTAQLTSNLSNKINYGFTRQGLESSGVQNQPVVTFRNLSPIFGTSLSNGRIIPVHNITDDATWTKVTHTLVYGVNLCFHRNWPYRLSASV